MRTTINPYYHDKTISLPIDALIQVNYPDADGDLVALLSS